jgi:hypothetical protein
MARSFSFTVAFGIAIGAALEESSPPLDPSSGPLKDNRTWTATAGTIRLSENLVGA